TSLRHRKRARSVPPRLARARCDRAERLFLRAGENFLRPRKEQGRIRPWRRIPRVQPAARLRGRKRSRRNPRARKIRIHAARDPESLGIPPLLYRLHVWPGALHPPELAGAGAPSL